MNFQADSLPSLESLATLRARLAHAYILKNQSSGPDAMLKNICASVLCLDDQDNLQACGQCASCRSLSGENLVHADLRLVFLQDKAKFIKVEQIRDLIAFSTLKPMSGSKKVLWVDQAHLMNEIAQNALLKTLEEPPGDCHFFLRTPRPEALLLTLRSRCRVCVLDYSGGSTLAEDEELKQVKYDALLWLVKILDGQTQTPLDVFWSLDRQQSVYILDAMLVFLRDAMVETSLGEASMLNYAWQAQSKALAQKYGPGVLADALECVAQSRERIYSNAHQKLVWSDTALALAGHKIAR